MGNAPPQQLAKIKAMYLRSRNPTTNHIKKQIGEKYQPIEIASINKAPLCVLDARVAQVESRPTTRI